MEETPKKITVVTGDGNDLEISEVREHLNVAKPKTKDNKDKKNNRPRRKEKIRAI